MNTLAIDPGLNGAGAVSDESGAFIACFDLPTIGEGAQRRVDVANLADLIREHGPYAFAIVEQVGARPGQGVSSMFRFGQAYGTILGVIGRWRSPSAMCRRRSGRRRSVSTARAKPHVLARSRPGRPRPSFLPVSAITAAQRLPCWGHTR
jgi:hypothetical protein